MITISTSININLMEIETLRRWIEYMPKCFTDNLENTDYIDRLEKDKFIAWNIKKLYLLIKEITGKDPDYENKCFNMGNLTLEQYDRFQEIKNNIPINFDFDTYAKLKLTKEQQLFCHNFVNNYLMINSTENNNIDDISDYFLKSYIKYLLMFSRIELKKITESINNAVRKLERRSKITEEEEKHSWELMTKHKTGHIRGY